MRNRLSKTDKLCAISLGGILAVTVAANVAMDEAALRAAEHVDKPSIAATDERIDYAISYADFLLARQEAVEDVDEIEEPDVLAGVPLDDGCKTALLEACEDYNVPIHLALGLIDVESNFDPMAENGVSYGLCQLNKKYWPEGLTPEGNITCGISYLGELLEQYGDTAAALTAYNAGYDTSSREYANKVLDASEKWEAG